MFFLLDIAGQYRTKAPPFESATWQFFFRPFTMDVFSAKKKLMSDVLDSQASLELIAVSVEFQSPGWHANAMCRGKTGIFFATPGERRGRRNRREALARAYCACCPVAKECRDAGRVGREHGLWGSENDEQRSAEGFGPRSPHRRAVAAAAYRALHNDHEFDDKGQNESEVA
jgi:hypothetical protein